MLINKKCTSYNMYLRKFIRPLNLLSMGNIKPLTLTPFIYEIFKYILKLKTSFKVKCKLKIPSLNCSKLLTM